MQRNSYSRMQTVKRRKSIAVKVIELVESIRFQMPKIGTRKLYFRLEDELKQLNVGRDILFRILKANHMLIQPKRWYHVTTNSHHRFRKHMIWLKMLFRKSLNKYGCQI